MSSEPVLLTDPPPAVVPIQGSDAYGRLGDALHRFVAATFLAGRVDDDALDAIATDVDRAAAQLEAAIDDASADGPRLRIPYGHSPTTPRLSVSRTGARYRVRVQMDPTYEGPPGFVHGGWIALMFDQVLARADFDGRASGMTTELTVRYRRPTPIDAELVFEAERAQLDGRSTTILGTLSVDGQVTCTARGVFARLKPERAEQYFGDVKAGFLGSDEPQA
jgi:acyl-coenzyme A thioesterase PaaI-like protein